MILVVVGTACCWAGTIANGVLFLTAGQRPISLLAFGVCLAVSMWATYNVVQVVLMERER